jgi:GAF domain-containing protein
MPTLSSGPLQRVDQERRAVDAAVFAWAEATVTELSRERDFTHCSLFLYDAAADALRLIAQVWGAGEDTGAVIPGEWLVPLHGSVCGWVFRSASPALVADVRHHGDFRSYPGAATRSELAVPIVLDGEVVGVLNVESPRVGQFGIRDVQELNHRAAEAAEGLAGLRAEERAGSAQT